MGFEGRTAIVTGAARGIGRAIAARLAAQGVRVLIGDVDEAEAERAALAIGHETSSRTSAGGGAAAQRLDVTSASSWSEAVARVTSAWGRLDILVNNAGIAGRSAPVWEYSVEEWQQVIAIDLTGVFLGCRAVLPAMIEAGWGRIVNISSIAGK